jgi:hypothetical protein
MQLKRAEVCRAYFIVGNIFYFVYHTGLYVHKLHIKYIVSKLNHTTVKPY